MQWENLTAPEFAKAVKSTGGVCVIAMGVLERHSDHMPLGTDALNGHKICCLAAEQEPAVVFPLFYFGQIFEARCFPGTLTIKPTLLIELIQNVFDEIGRNGFRKIVVHNAHGGNWAMLQFLMQCALWEQKPYSLYLQTDWLSPDQKERKKALLETKEGGHACEEETSVTLATFPELVHMENVPVDPATSLKRLQHMPAHFSGIKWYSQYPEHYAGDAHPATAAKGQEILDMMVKNLATFIGAVKNDEVAPALEAEFFKRVSEVGK